MNIKDLDIEKLVTESIKAEILQLDVEAIVRGETADIVRDIFAKKAEAMLSDVISEFISKSITEAMAGEIVISDGWHASKKYESFEEFVKSEFNKRLGEDYKIRAVIEQSAKQRVDSLMKQEYAKVTEKIVDVLTQSTLVKK
jgi:hypothetical protein